MLLLFARGVVLILIWNIMLGGEHDERAVIRPVVVLDEGRDARLEEIVQLTEAAIAAPASPVEEDEEWSRLAFAVSWR